MWALFSIISAFFGVIFVFVYCCWSSTYWRRRGVSGPIGCPIVGNLMRFFLARKHYGDVYANLYKKYPELPYVGIYRFFNEPAILVRSLDLVKDVMVRHFQHFPNNVVWANPERDPLVWCNPFVARGENWKRMRAEVVPIFTPNRVKSSFAHIQLTCKKLEDFVKWPLQFDSDCFEAKNLFAKFTLDIVASCAYGLNGECFTSTQSDFTQLVEQLFQPNPWSLVETTALLFSPRLGNMLGYCYIPPKVQNWLNTIINRIISDRLAEPRAKPPHNDFIEWLIEGRRRAQQPLDRAVVVGHCSTFLLEGFETSSSLMAFAMFQFAANPDVQAKVLREIDQVLAAHHNLVSYEALQEMTYLEAALHETLRLHPPMPALLKECSEAYTLPGQTSSSQNFHIARGTVLVIPVKAIHYDAEYFPEPFKFQPERFHAHADGRQRQQQYPAGAFLGFGEGPRMCPGMRFGLTQSKAGLVTILAAHTVNFARKHKRPLEMAPTTFLTAAADGIWLALKARK